MDYKEIWDCWAEDFQQITNKIIQMDSVVLNLKKKVPLILENLDVLGSIILKELENSCKLMKS